MSTSPIAPKITCSTCNSIWSEGQYSQSCEECGGGAMQHACILCSGTCGAMWSRAIIDSQDSHIAHWAGNCYHQTDPLAEPENRPRSKQRYLFRFGYETPAQKISNARGGWDDQDSSWVFVESTSKREAAELGRAFADLYVLRLYKNENPLIANDGDAYVWSEAEYAEWIEEDRDEISSAEGYAPVITGPQELVRAIRALQ